MNIEGILLSALIGAMALAATPHSAIARYSLLDIEARNPASVPQPLCVPGGVQWGTGHVARRLSGTGAGSDRSPAGPDHLVLRVWPDQYTIVIGPTSPRQRIAVVLNGPRAALDTLVRCDLTWTALKRGDPTASRITLAGPRTLLPRDAEPAGHFFTLWSAPSSPEYVDNRIQAVLHLVEGRRVIEKTLTVTQCSTESDGH